MSRPILEAQFAGECPACGQCYEAGRLITPLPGGWGHYSCPADPLTVDRTPCPQCFQVPSVTGKCACYEAGEFDGRWLLALGVFVVVLLVLFAVTANPGSVH